MKLRWPMFCVLMVGLALPAASQEPTPPMRGRGGERVEEFKKIRMMDALKLDEETSVRFFARYNKHRDTMHEFQDRANKLIDKLESLRQKKASDEELQAALQELQGVQEEMTKERTRYMEDLKSLLTPGQLADYLVFERNFYRNLRETLRDMQRERMDRKEKR